MRHVEDLPPQGLLWYALEKRDEKTLILPFRPQQYRAPSWSWTSVEGLVYYHFAKSYRSNLRDSENFHISIMDIVARTEEDNRGVGRVASAFLRSNGYFLVITWKGTGFPKGEYGPEIRCRHGDLISMKDDNGSECSIPNKPPYWSLQFDSIDDLRRGLLELKDGSGGRLCLPIYSRRISRKAPFADVFSFDLLILKSKGESKYESVGLLNIFYE